MIFDILLFVFIAFFGYVVCNYFVKNSQVRDLVFNGLIIEIKNTIYNVYDKVKSIVTYFKKE